MELKGKVVMKKFGKSSKSEHDAVYLETKKGNFVLRQVGSNAFENKELKKLLGKEVTATGTVKDYLFLAKTIKEIDR
jgi:hypothetical protein